MGWESSFWLPPDSSHLEFLFLPSDEQYCGSTGPADLNFDPCPEPAADDSIMESRWICAATPQPATVSALPSLALAPAAHDFDDEWFPARMLTVETYASLVSIARGPLEHRQRVRRSSRVSNGQLVTTGFVFHVPAGAEEDDGGDGN